MKKPELATYILAFVVSFGLLPVTVIADTKEAAVFFSMDAGADISDEKLSLSAPEGYTVYYTTDGSDPVVSSENLYEGPLSLQAGPGRFAKANSLINIGDYAIYEDENLPKAITVKAMAVREDGETTPVETRTFFFQERESVAVISISTDYGNLLDYNTGIMVKGAKYDAWRSTSEAQPILYRHQYWSYQGNYTQKGREWERPAVIEIFDGDNYIVQNGGIRLHGGASRMYSQRAFNIYFREEYGKKELEYVLFKDAVSGRGESIAAYKDFVLRNGGNDTEFLKFHDSLIQNLLKDLHIATQAERPAVLYLNGEYMGIYVLQEKYTDKFIADHYEVDRDNVILIKEGEIEEGEDEDIALYNEMLSFADRDLSDLGIFEEFCSVVDLDSMIDFYAAEIYIGNADWNPRKNTRLWRVRTPENESNGDGRWRWILYDTEFSSSLYGWTHSSFEYNSFSAAVAADPLFAAAVKNKTFYSLFLDRSRELSYAYLDAGHVDRALKAYAEMYKPYMEFYYKRYGDTSEEWEKNIQNIRVFFSNRAEYILPYIEQF